VKFHSQTGFGLPDRSATGSSIAFSARISHSHTHYAQRLPRLD
jgi:hypothetical protein